MHSVIFMDEADEAAATRLEARLDGFPSVRVALSSIDRMVLGGDSAAVALWSPTAAALGLGEAIARSPAAASGRLLVVRTPDAPQVVLPAHAGRVSVVDLVTTESTWRGAMGLVGLRHAPDRSVSMAAKRTGSSTRGALAFAPGAGLGMMIFAGMFVGATAFSRDEIMTAVDANFEISRHAESIRSALYPAPLEAYFGKKTFANATDALEPIARASFAPVLRASFEAPAEVLADASGFDAPIQPIGQDVEQQQAPVSVRFEEASLRVEPINVILTYAEPLESSLLSEPGAFLADVPSIDVIENALYE